MNNVATTFAAYLAASDVSGRAHSKSLNNIFDADAYRDAVNAAKALGEARKAWHDALDAR